MFLIVGVQQVFAKITDRRVAVGVNSNQIDLTGDRLPPVPDSYHRRNMHHGRQSNKIIAKDLANLLLHQSVIRDAVGAVAFDNDVRQDAVHATLHFGRESIHDAVNNN